MASRRRDTEGREELDAILDGRASPGIRAAFEAEILIAYRQLRHSFRHRSRETLTHGFVGEIMQIFGRALNNLFYQVGGRLVRGTRETLTRSLEQFVSVLRSRGAISQDDFIQEVIRSQIAESAASIEQSMSTLAVGSRDRALFELVKLEAHQVPVSEAILSMQDVASDEWWRIERIVRTETSRAFNAARSVAIDHMQENLPGVMKRWTELVDDATGAPLDKRVGLDSLVMHGQVAAPGALFVMPTDPRAGTLAGRSWMFPPNRPNDRAVLVPWHGGWGLPAYRTVGGMRVPML